jgi:competence protein ComEA
MDSPAGTSTVEDVAPEPAQLMAAAVDGLPSWLGRVVERWSPVGLRNARTDPGRRGAVALVAVALLAALTVGAYVWHGRPQARQVAPPPVGLAAAPPGSAPPGSPASTASTGSLVVAVTGKVRRPGVVTVSPGARVIDVVKAAGGTLPGADLAMLNLARKVADGELVAVGVTGPAPGAGDPGAPVSGGDAAGPGTPAGPVDLNTATLAQLDTLPGVGPVLAQRILDWRAAHGQFGSVDELSDVPGIGDARMAQLRDLVRV